MPSEIRSWQISDGKLVPLQTSLVEAGKRERDDLEEWIRTNPAILGEDIAVIGEQVQTASGPLDFLGIDTSGNTVIVELKRDMVPREAVVQAMDYASDIAGWDIDHFREICKSFTTKNLEDYLQEKFEGIDIEDLGLNQTQRLLLVGFSASESLGRIVEWLSDRHSVSINVVMLNYVRTSGGEEILSRTVMIPEEEAKHKADKAKFIIDMSNEPGNYDSQELELRLIEYLSKALYSSQRIRDYFLPILLEKGQTSREQLRKEFVKREAAPDESQAGYFLSLISSQLGFKWNDFLRQVVRYEYPRHKWEKDNFRIEDKYKDLVKSVLQKAQKPTT